MYDTRTVDLPGYEVPVLHKPPERHGLLGLWDRVKTHLHHTDVASPKTTLGDLSYTVLGELQGYGDGVGLSGSRSKRLAAFANAQNAQIDKFLKAGDTAGAAKEAAKTPWVTAPTDAAVAKALEDPSKGAGAQILARVVNRIQNPHQVNAGNPSKDVQPGTAAFNAIITGQQAIVPYTPPSAAPSAQAPAPDAGVATPGAPAAPGLPIPYSAPAAPYQPAYQPSGPAPYAPGYDPSQILSSLTGAAGGSPPGASAPDTSGIGGGPAGTVTLPLLGPVPTVYAAGAVALGAFVWWRRSKRKKGGQG